MKITIKEYGDAYSIVSNIECDNLIMSTPNSIYRNINSQKHLCSNNKVLYVFDFNNIPIKYIVEYNNYSVTYDPNIDSSPDEFANIINEFLL